MPATTLREELSELYSAEEFLSYFGIDFDPAVVNVNRLHILQRFHDYLRQADPGDRHGYARCLRQAYQDFVDSDARTEKVFKVFQRQAAMREVRIPLATIGRPA
jgi:nitrogenase-stabilizing/protective protein